MRVTIKAMLMFLLVSLYAMGSWAGEAESLPAIDEFIPVEQMPEMIESVQPVYPEKAKEAGVECVLYVQALVDKDGKVRKATITKCTVPDQGFEESAIKAALKSKYKPAMNKDKPVAVWVTYKVNFSLSDADCEKTEN